jgi:hypothetical protein
MGLVFAASCREAVAPIARTSVRTLVAVPVEVNRMTGTVRIIAGLSAPSAARGVSLALLNGESVTLAVSNLTSSPVGAFRAGYVRVRFDLVLSHKLGASQLVTPTVPTPPPGIDGLLVFPLQTIAYATSGATDGLASAPDGSVQPSDEWNGFGVAGGGGPFNLFGTTSCSQTPAACTRLIALPSPMLANTPSLPRTVGFDVEPGIATFRTWIAVAADVVDLPL